ncbi:hypothetical protein NESM_000427000 [Novymonas esmeraldas]|uniref:Terminase small subunit n=1 Tax=Novymonas esmeraldas TaxID=1808958 RepID=A0AAW0EP24_9TRYP
MPPRDRFHSPRAPHHPPSRFAKKEGPRHVGKRVGTAAGPSSTAPSASAVAAASTAREHALRGALVKALSHSSSAGESGAASASANSVDAYGTGSPTDRLQFGYSPAVAAEAVAFHARFTAEAWVAARKSAGRIAFVKKQKLEVPHCEPITSILKLQSHWKQLNLFQSGIHGSTGSKLKADDLDRLVEMLASKQRIDDDDDDDEDGDKTA